MVEGEETGRAYRKDENAAKPRKARSSDLNTLEPSSTKKGRKRERKGNPAPISNIIRRKIRGEGKETKIRKLIGERFAGERANAEAD